MELDLSTAVSHPPSWVHAATQPKYPQMYKNENLWMICDYSAMELAK